MCILVYLLIVMMAAVSAAPRPGYLATSLVHTPLVSSSYSSQSQSSSVVHSAPLVHTAPVVHAAPFTSVLHSPVVSHAVVPAAHLTYASVPVVKQAILPSLYIN